AAAAPAPKPLSSSELLRRKRRQDLERQISDIDRQVTEKTTLVARLRETIAEYQTKVDATPRRESGLVEPTRDYTTLQSTYASLLGKRQDSKIAANLERRNIGEQFRVLEPARVPQRPVSPDRRLIELSGTGGGLALGLLILGVLEYLDSSFK